MKKNNSYYQLENVISDIVKGHSSIQNLSESNDTKSILITSASKKVPLIKSVKRAIDMLGGNIQIIAADIDENVISRYFSDDFWVMPKLCELKVDTLLEYCKKHNVRYIIPTRDGELQFFSVNKQYFFENGVSVLISDKNVIEVCLDKLKFYNHAIELGFSVIPTFKEISNLDCEMFVVKERYGSGSRNIGLSLNRNKAIHHAQNLEFPIYQPYILGEEYSADVYLTTDSKCKGVVLRKRKLVVDGESQITYTVKNPGIEMLISKFSEKIGLVGHAVIQYILDENGCCYIIECNPRLGGASKLSLEMGLDSIYWFLLESNGVELNSVPFTRSLEEKTLVRYAEDLII